MGLTIGLIAFLCVGCLWHWWMVEILRDEQFVGDIILPTVTILGSIVTAIGLSIHWYREAHSAILILLPFLPLAFFWLTGVALAFLPVPMREKRLALQKGFGEWMERQRQLVREEEERRQIDAHEAILLRRARKPHRYLKDIDHARTLIYEETHGRELWEPFMRRVYALIGKERGSPCAIKVLFDYFAELERMVAKIERHHVSLGRDGSVVVGDGAGNLAYIKGERLRIAMLLNDIRILVANCWDNVMAINVMARSDQAAALASRDSNLLPRFDAIGEEVERAAQAMRVTIEDDAEFARAQAELDALGDVLRAPLARAATIGIADEMRGANNQSAPPAAIATAVSKS